MTGITAREMLDAAIALEEGQKIVTQCDSYEEMESLRINLYKSRKALLKVHKALAYSLYISREIKGNNWFVTIAKELSVSKVIIVGKDGSVKPFERTEAAVGTEENEQERLVRLMKEDGLPELEIEEALTKQGEDDFDKAALKIEEAQAAVEKGEKE